MERRVSTAFRPSLYMLMLVRRLAGQFRSVPAPTTSAAAWRAARQPVMSSHMHPGRLDAPGPARPGVGQAVFVRQAMTVFSSNCFSVVVRLRSDAQSTRVRYM